MNLTVSMRVFPQVVKLLPFVALLFTGPVLARDDIVVDFGGIGLWARMNDSNWVKLNNSSPDQLVVGDMDGSGGDDVIADFTSTFGGIFVRTDLRIRVELACFSE